MAGSGYRLKPFYAMGQKDKLLKALVKNFYGYRIVGQPDLFESIVWAVLGQQINVQFAYTLKQKFVERYGEAITLKRRDLLLVPDSPGGHSAYGGTTFGPPVFTTKSSLHHKYFEGICFRVLFQRKSLWDCR